MGVQLHLEGSELRLRELSAERRLLQLAGLELLIVKQGMHTDDDERRDDEVDVKAKAEVDPETRCQGWEELTETRQDQTERRELNYLMTDGQNDDGRNMHEQVQRFTRPRFDYTH